jgi:tRNA(fMet)-specific endonuclease VapC
MRYLLDANIMVRALAGVGQPLMRRIAASERGQLFTSSIAYAEVVHGSVRGKPPPFSRLEAFTDEVPVLDFDYQAARAYATLPFRRSSFDRLIAAHALALGLILVTDNEADFADVPWLRVENWTV